MDRSLYKQFNLKGFQSQIILFISNKKEKRNHHLSLVLPGKCSRWVHGHTQLLLVTQVVFLKMHKTFLISCRSFVQYIINVISHCSYLSLLVSQKFNLRVGNFFCKDPDSKYYWLWRLKGQKSKQFYQQLYNEKNYNSFRKIIKIY